MDVCGIGISQLNHTDEQIQAERSRIVKLVMLKYKCLIIAMLLICCLILAVFMILSAEEKDKLLYIIERFHNHTDV